MSDGGPREVALQVILRVTEHGGYSNLALRGALRRSGLGRDDRALATELAYGTLRKLIPLDRSIRDAAGRVVSSITPRARALVRLGAYQLFCTRIPSHAAVGETVELAGPRERGFVNAVLRRLAESTLDPPQGVGADDVAARTGLAAWAVRELRRLVGPEAETAAASLAERAPVCLRVNRCRTSPDRLEARLREAGLRPSRGRIHEECLLLDGVTPDALPGWSEGWFAVQDQASAFVVEAVEAEPGDRILDACAGPGGKAAHLACVVSPGRLVAADVSPRRASQVRAYLDRLGVRGLVLAQDALRPGLRGAFDRVLVDAPCSGIGAARRRPELLWRQRREDLSRLARLQVGLASNAAELLRPGGRLVYSVCTFPRAETDAVCDALQGKRPDLEPDGVAGPDGRSPRVRLWPHRHGTDAMFVAAFRRRNLA